MTLQRAMDNYGSEDMIVPEIKLIQAVGGDYAKGAGAKPGDFFFVMTEEVVAGEKGFEVVVADLIKTRTFWGRTDIQEGEPPDCSSRDARISLDGKSCETCEHKMDNPAAYSIEERRKRCSVGYNLLTILVSDSSPAVMRLTGISAGAARALLTTLKLNKKINGQVERAVVQVTSEKKKTASGEAYAVHFKVSRLLEGDDAAASLALTADLLGKTLELPVGTETAAQIPATVPAPPPLTTGAVSQPPAAPAKKAAPTVDVNF